MSVAFKFRCEVCVGKSANDVGGGLWKALFEKAARTEEHFKVGCDLEEARNPFRPNFYRSMFFTSA